MYLKQFYNKLYDKTTILFSMQTSKLFDAKPLIELYDLVKEYTIKKDTFLNQTQEHLKKMDLLLEVITQETNKLKILFANQWYIIEDYYANQQLKEKQKNQIKIDMDEK